MSRIIKAPNIQFERDYNIVERDKVMRHAEDEAAELIDAVRVESERVREEAHEEAEALRNAAQQELEEMKAQLEEENAAVREQAKEQGHQEGLNQGLQESKQQIAGLVQQLKAMTVEGQAILEGMFRDQEPEIRSIICDAMSRILQLKLEEDDQIAVRITQECIQQTADRKSIRILLHEDDKAAVEEWAPEFMKEFDDLEKIDIAVDPRVDKGGVMIDSPSGGIDGRIETQLDILTDTIENE
ncbi:MAG: FliH/SctL family protein [Candidatus Hinthialibacter antarcticus]|nr:FliH/SctL family protein [Candidatus Hinthialibacter antarcticus]